MPEKQQAVKIRIKPRSGYAPLKTISTRVRPRTEDMKIIQEVTERLAGGGEDADLGWWNTITAGWFTDPGRTLPTGEESTGLVFMVSAQQGVSKSKYGGRSFRRETWRLRGPLLAFCDYEVDPISRRLVRNLGGGQQEENVGVIKGNSPAAVFLRSLYEAGLRHGLSVSRAKRMVQEFIEDPGWFGLQLGWKIKVTASGAKKRLVVLDCQDEEEG